MIKVPAVIGNVLPNLNLSALGVVWVELDQPLNTQGAHAGATPAYLRDRAPYSYFGATVWHGYVYQPANWLVRGNATRSNFDATGLGVIVADIDTGVDPNHPVLQNSLLPGYDFTRDQSGGSEMTDVSPSMTASMSPNAQPAQVSQSSVAVLDQSSVAVLDGPQYAAFGHGTMTAGLIHLIAPQAQILPLKSFQSDGSGYNSDILRAIYYAVNHNAKVINMSFNYTKYSAELAYALNYATSTGVICVAAAGNDGTQTTVYPAALKGVIAVASTDNNDVPSSFSNYGAPPIWLAAPGEGVMTLYPFGTYAAGWGTSFSTPLVAGAAALLVASPNVNVSTGGGISIGPINLSTSLSSSANAPNWVPQVANALAHAHDIPDPQMGHGRLDIFQAMQAWQASMGAK